MAGPEELDPSFLTRFIKENVQVRDARAAAAKANIRELRKILQQSGTSFTGLYTFHLTVADEELLAQMSSMVGANIIFSKTIQAARTRFAPLAKPLLEGIITSVAAAQLEEGAFPARYVGPILRAVKAMPEPQVGGVTPYFAWVDIPDLQQYLGDSDEFALAFHHGATLDKGIKSGGNFYQRHNILRGPIHETKLRYGESSRYQYWKALYQGKRSVKIPVNSSFGISNIGKKLGFTHLESAEVPIAGSWQETIDARLAVWAETGKAPQWVLLEHGQPRWKPKVVIPQGMGHFARGKGKSTLSDVRSALDKVSSGDNIAQTQKSYNTKIEKSGTIFPGNITGEWVDSLGVLWSDLVQIIWTQQIEEFNRTHTAVNIDIKSNRLRSTRTGRFLKWGKAEPLFPTRSTSPREFGKKYVTRMRNEPLFTDTEWEETFGDDY